MIEASLIIMVISGAAFLIFSLQVVALIIGLREDKKAAKEDEKFRMLKAVNLIKIHLLTYPDRDKLPKNAKEVLRKYEKMYDELSANENLK